MTNLGRRKSSFRDLTESMVGNPATANFSSFSGSDIMAFIFGNDVDLSIAQIEASDATELEKQSAIDKVKSGLKIEPFGELHTISVSIAATPGPVRRLGEKEVVEYKLGARTIAGTLIFSQLNKDIFSAYMNNKISGLHKGSLESPDYIDEIPPFNILIEGCNELGGRASGMLVGVKLTHFGTTFSVNDMFVESSYGYVARHYIPFTNDWKAPYLDYLASSVTSRSVSEIVYTDMVPTQDEWGDVQRTNSKAKAWFEALPENARRTILNNINGFTEGLNR